VSAQQDSRHPSGVTQTRQGRQGVGDYAYRQRNRKADAALSLRMSGASWSDVAKTLGFPTPRAALVATERALVKQLDETDREKMRLLAGVRLERLLRGVWEKAIDPDNPDQMAAVTRARELIDRHAKLFGLDAPTEIVVHSPTQSDLEDWVLRMTSNLVPAIEEPDIFDAEVIPESDLAS
jgi:hypothetical protein